MAWQGQLGEIASLCSQGQGEGLGKYQAPM